MSEAIKQGIGLGIAFFVAIVIFSLAFRGLSLLVNRSEFICNLNEGFRNIWRKISKK